MNMNNNKACNITTTIRNPCNTYVTLSTEVNVKGPYSKLLRSTIIAEWIWAGPTSIVLTFEVNGIILS